MSEVSWLKKLDFSVGAERPDYALFFELLDELRIKSGDDLQAIELPFEHRHLVGDVIWDSIRYVEAGEGHVRVISDGPSNELVLFSRLMADQAIILSDCEVNRYSRSLGNPVHTAYWTGLLDQMMLCRESLVDGELVVSPSIVRRTIRDMQESDYEIDFTDSLENFGSTFLGSDPMVRNYTNVSTKRVTPEVVPLMEIKLPVFRNIDPWELSQILQDEGVSFQKLRYALSDFRQNTGDELAGANLNEMAEHLDYEVANLHNQYKSILRQREATLGKIALGTAGLVLAIVAPPALAPIAAALGTAAAGVNAVDYVTKVRDSRALLTDNDYYLAWKAIRSGGT